MTQDFYRALYTSEGVEDVEELLHSVPLKVTSEMNQDLLKPYTVEEVKSALLQMFPTKAPGPDGYPAHFFQKHWSMCGEEVVDMVLKILRGEDDMEIINKTFIVLIPKVANPSLLSQFRPISLCNVIYLYTR